MHREHPTLRIETLRDAAAARYVHRSVQHLATMLREDTIRLLAAFDHRDILIDPDPDPKASFAERKRLFALPRSSWQDYDKALISRGGGVFPRSAKEIRLSAEARKLFGVGESVTPQELMKAILKAPVDLLFFGGIGTYVRASNESEDAVGDRANDAIRVTGADLNCKVIGEGANLGMVIQSSISERALARVMAESAARKCRSQTKLSSVTAHSSEGGVISKGDLRSAITTLPAKAKRPE